MTKHACGSCRFFQEARDNKQGWCTHPDRRETTAVRILVRSAELRCRNDWGQDLWQDRTDNDQVLDIAMSDSPSKPIADSSARPIPAPPVESRPIVYPAASVSETVRVSDTEQAKLVSDNLNRELLRRAHDQARERVRNRGYSADAPSDGTASPPVEREALVISNQYVPPSRQVEPSADQPGIFEFDNKAGTGKFDERVVTSVPASFVSDSITAEQVTVKPRDYAPTGVDAYLSESTANLSTVDLSSDANGTRWTEDAVVSTPPAEQAVLDEAERPSRYTYRTNRETDVRRADRTQSQASRDYVQPLPSYSADLDRDFPDEPEDLYEADEHIEQANWPAPLRSADGVWSGIVKTCQTCRDFRPAGNGQRGWCTNQWAFKHRRMVDASDRPCETSIGHWWIPGDVAWQGTLDMAALGQPTPNVDKFLGRSDEADRKRRQS